jgi:hypothetical protein
MAEKKLEMIVFINNGKWVKAANNSKKVNPEPIGPPFCRQCSEGPDMEEIEISVRSCIDQGVSYNRKYNEVNAYSYHLGDSSGIPIGYIQIQLHKI